MKKKAKDYVDRIFELQMEAFSLPDGAARLALLEEAVQVADAAQDVEQGFYLRKDLMSSAEFSGRPDMMLVAFSWCLAQADKDPERFDLPLWEYKWVISEATSFPDLARSKLDELLADFERRYREIGSTMQAVSLLKREMAIHSGDRKLAREAQAELRTRKRDWLSDCPACVAHKNCDYYSFLGQWGRAVQAAQQVLQGKLTCAEEPHRTLSSVLLPLLHLGRLEEAKEHQKRGYRLIGKTDHFVQEFGEHLEFLALTGDFAAAKRVLERHLPHAMDIVSPEERFQFLLSAKLWTDCLLRRGTRTLKLRLPNGPPAPGEDGKTDVKALGDWFLSEAQQIAQRFDARNGTPAFQKKIEESPALMKLAVE
jgi:hypothetical protein